MTFTFDGLVLAAVISELRKLLSGGRVQHIRQHNPTDITIELRQPGHTYSLYLSADARFPRIHLTSSAQPIPPSPPQFCMTLRKHLEGSKLTSVEQVRFDRIAILTFTRTGQGDRVLILEIMGKHSNLILTDELGRIIAAAKHIGSSVSRYRQILPGREYVPPPYLSKINLTSPKAIEELHQAIQHISSLSSDPQAVQMQLVETLSGFGPFLAGEIVTRARTNGAIDPNRLLKELIRLREIILHEVYEPVIVSDSLGNTLMAYPIPVVQFPPQQQHTRQSINTALDAVYRSLTSKSELDTMKREVITVIRKTIDTKKRVQKSLERTIDESANAERYRQIGELILVNMHTINKGAKVVTLTDYFDPNMPSIEVELDEKLTPQQNAERYFKRYQKLRDAGHNAQERLKNITSEIATLEQSLESAEAATTIPELEQLKTKLAEQGFPIKTQPQRTQLEDELNTHHIKRILTDNGWEILYGETAEANDYLTQRIAAPNDTWLHARSVKGAHVIVRSANRQTNPPRHILMQAAMIAAMNSDAKHSGLIPVDCTQKKYVRKPKGAPPGYVVYRNEKTIDVCPRE
ncbi:MAG: Rqc2 family fibronectin-binding protein [Armatimonadota bacterium]